MQPSDIYSCINFLQQAENLKNTVRSAHTSTGKVESAAEHSWRLCLMIVLFAPTLQGLDVERVLKMAVIHDLAEAVLGDIPAVDPQSIHKGAEEYRVMQHLTSSLPTQLGEQLLCLWEEYEHGSSPEARFLKGLDKLETIMQHNQGMNPENFNYVFNLTYGQQYTHEHPLLVALREYLDKDTHTHIR